MKLTMKPAIAALVATTLLTSTAAIAGPGSVTSAGVTQGKLELKNDLIAAFDYEDDANEEYEAKLEVEYGVTDKLQLKLEGEGKHTAGADTEFEKVKLAAKHELTKQGDYFFDSAAQLSYSIGTTSGKADEIEGELILDSVVTRY